MNNHSTFPPLSQETRDFITTRAAAYYLMRAQQTLRIWAMNGSGPVRPVRVGKRLGWPVADIRRLVGAQQQSTPEQW